MKQDMNATPKSSNTVANKLNSQHGSSSKDTLKQSPSNKLSQKSLNIKVKQLSLKCLQVIEVESESEEEEHGQTNEDFFGKKPTEGPKLREFEAIDLIHERLKQKTDDGLGKLEPLIKKQLHSLYYDRKVNVYMLT